MDDSYRERLHKRNEAVQNVFSNHKLPARVHMYHSLCPLERYENASVLFGYVTTVYKAIRTIDGKPYVLKRIHNYVIGNESALSCIESWRLLRHSGVVSVCEAFTTKSFGDTCTNLNVNI